MIKNLPRGDEEVDLDACATQITPAITQIHIFDNIFSDFSQSVLKTTEEIKQSKTDSLDIRIDHLIYEL